MNHDAHDMGIDDGPGRHSTPTIIRTDDMADDHTAGSREGLADNYFHDMYRDSDDPWGFTSRWYEQRKYALSLAALSSPRYGSVFEPGCSVGVLSAQLATRADHLLCMDVSPRAVELARERLDGHDSVEVRVGDIVSDWPPGRFDLISSGLSMLAIIPFVYTIKQVTGGKFDLLTAAVLVGGTAIDSAVLAPLLPAWTRDDLDSGLARLWLRSLLWRPADGYEVVRGIEPLLGPHPGELGPPAAALGVAVLAPSDLESAIAAAPAPGGAIAARLASGPPVAHRPDPGGASAAAVEALVAAGVLATDGSAGSATVVLPREHGLALRGHLTDRAPAPADVTAADADGPLPLVPDVDAAGGLAAADLVAVVEELLRAWDAEPPRVLRSGDLGVRDLRRAAGALELDDRRAATVLGLLWDSWEDDAEIRDVATRRFIDRDKLHRADFSGRFFSVRGPSITPRPPQGQPVVAALGHAPIPYEFAARAADLLFVTPTLTDGPAPLLALVDEAVRRVGRDGERLRVYADVVVLLDGETESGAERLARLDAAAGSPITSDAAIFAGSADDLADLLLDWSDAGVDGVRLRPGALPDDLTAITRRLVPALQARGRFRTEYPEGPLRALLGLPSTVPNRYATV